MKAKVTVQTPLNNILQKYAILWQGGVLAFANECNKIAVTICNEKEGIVHRNNIRNWLIGKSGKIRDLRQLIIVAHLLGILGDDFAQLLEISKHPSAQKIFEDINFPIEYRQLVSKWLTPATKLNALLNKIPLPDYGQLIGRETEVTALAHKLNQSPAVSIVVLYGMSGIGKSTLAQTVARTALRQGGFQNVIWVEWEKGQSNETPKRAVFAQMVLTKLADKLLGLTSKTSVAKLESKLGEFLEQYPHLIIIDNLELDDFTHSALSMLHTLAHGSKFLITSQKISTKSEWLFSHRVLELSAGESADFLKHVFAITESTPPSDTFIDTIYQYVGGHPKALERVAHLTKFQSEYTIIENFSQGRFGIIDELFQTSHTYLWGELTENSQRLLVTMCFTLLGGISGNSLEGLSALRPNKNFHDALRQLVYFGLINRISLNTGSNKSQANLKRKLPHDQYKIHQITRRFLESLISHQPNIKEVVGNQLIKIIDTQCDEWLGKKTITATELSKQHAQLSQLLQIGLNYPNTKHKAAETLLRLCVFAENTIYWIEWNALLQQVAAMPWENQLMKYRLYSRLGWFQRINSQYTLAVESHRMALNIAKGLTTESTKAQAREHLNLCVIHRSQRQYALAHNHGMQALEFFDGIEAESKYLAPTYNSLGLNAHWYTRFVQSYRFFERAIEHFEAAEGYSGLIRTHNNWGDMLTSQGLFQEAQEQLNTAIDYVERYGEGFDKLIVSISLCRLSLDTASTDHAAQIYEQFLSEYQTHSTPSYYRMMIALYCGRIRLKQLRFVEAVEQLLEARELALEIGDEVAQAETYALIAQAQSGTGNWLQAGLTANTTIKLFERLQSDAWANYLYPKYELSLHNIKQKGQPNLG